MIRFGAYHVAALSAAMLVAFASGCKSSPETTSETAPTEEKKGEPQIADVDSELYSYQRGTDATKAIWSKYRFKGDGALLKNTAGDGALDFWFSAQAFDLLLDSVGIFWRKDLAADAVGIDDLPRLDILFFLHCFLLKQTGNSLKGLPKQR